MCLKIIYKGYKVLKCIVISHCAVLHRLLKAIKNSVLMKDNEDFLK